MKDVLIPATITDAISQGSWVDPGPERLAELLGLARRESPLRLFGDVEHMQRIHQLVGGRHGYVDDPEFCMVRRVSDRESPSDPRVAHEQAVFFGGSLIPGDDAFLVLDLSRPGGADAILWLDWPRGPPNRWISLGSLSSLIARLDESKGGG